MAKYRLGIRETDGKIIQKFFGNNPNHGASTSKDLSLTLHKHFDVVTRDDRQIIGCYNRNGLFVPDKPLMYRIEARSDGWYVISVRNPEVPYLRHKTNGWVGPYTYSQAQLRARVEREDEQGHVYIFSESGRIKAVSLKDLSALERKAILNGRDRDQIPVHVDFGQTVVYDTD